MLAKQIWGNNDIVPDWTFDKQNEYFNTVFKAAQICWWYALYDPDMTCDWSKKQMLRYSKNTFKIDAKYRMADSNYIAAKKRLAAIGFDCHQLSRQFPYTLKAKMYGKKIQFNTQKMAIYQFNNAIEETLFIGGQTLREIYKFSPEKLQGVYKNFLEVCGYYRLGIKEKQFIEYFEEIEKIVVIEDDKEKT